MRILFLGDVVGSPGCSKLVEGNFEGRYIWTGKCNVTDATLDRVVNYKKPN